MAIKLISDSFLLVTLLDKTKLLSALKVNLLTASWLSFCVLCNAVMPQGGKLDSVLRGCAEAAEKEAGAAGTTAWGAGVLGAGPRGVAGSQVPQSGGPLGVTGVLCSF